MYDLLKEVATAQSWEFIYARDDHKNLFDEIEDKSKTYLFLDPVIRDEIDNDAGELEEVVYSGAFMLVLSSDLDEKTYDDRYQDYIKGLIQTNNTAIKDSLKCKSEISVTQWRTVEVINALDYNFDGLIVSYTVKEKI
jgi:hypothetical protein